MAGWLVGVVVQGKDCRAEQSQEKNCRDKVAKAYTIANFKCNRWAVREGPQTRTGLREA